MATTQRGIYYNDDIDDIADIEADMKELAESVDTALDDLDDEKVDKVIGKGLSTEDYTTAEQEKLAGLENYDDSELTERVEDIEAEQTEQNNSIETLQTKVSELKQETKDLRNASYKIYTETPSTNVTLNKTSKNKFVKFGVAGNRKQTTYQGYNLFPNTNTSNYTITNTGGYTEEANRLCSDYVDVSNMTNLTLSNAVVNFDFAGIALYDESKNFISRTTINGNKIVTIATTAETKYARAFLQMNTTSIDATILTTDKIMLVSGTYTSSTIPDYEPYTYGQAPNPNYECPIYAVGDNGVVNVVKCNKNLLQNIVTSTTKNGVTVTRNADGSITLNGTATVNTTIYFSNSNSAFSIPAGTYTWRLKGRIQNKNNFSWSANNSSYNGTIYSSAPEDYKTVTYTEPVNITGVSTYFANGTTFSNVTLYPMLYKGSYNANIDYTPHEEEVFNIPCQKPMPDQSDYFDWDNEKEIHNWGKIASYNGETITTEYISTTGQLTTGAAVYYKLTTPEQLPFTAEQKTVAKQIKDSTSYYEQTNVYSNDNVSPNFDVTAIGDQNLIIDSIDARLSLVE